MPEVNSLILTLDGHCIETAARNRLREVTTKAIIEDIDEKISAEIEFLERFLSENDFKKIRAENPRLDGRENIKVKIIHTEDGKYLFEIEGIIL